MIKQVLIKVWQIGFIIFGILMFSYLAMNVTFDMRQSFNKWKLEQIRDGNEELKAKNETREQKIKSLELQIEQLKKDMQSNLSEPNKN